MRVLNEEIDRLTKLVDEKEEDLGELKLRFSDEAALVKRIQEHLSLFVILFAEIESLRKRVKDKEREVEDVRRSSLAPFRNWAWLGMINSYKHDEFVWVGWWISV